MISRRLLRIKILQILYAHFNADGLGIVKSEKDLAFSIQKAYDLYFYLLLMVIAIRRYAESRIELARNKRLPTYEDLHPNTRFVDNEAIRQIEEDKAFNRYMSERRMSWSNHPELIKNLYNRLTESEYYKKYMELPECGYADDKQLLVDFFAGELEEYDLFYDILEEQSIFWNDDVEFVVAVVAKTVKDMRSGKTGLLPMYKSDEDRDFAFRLLRTSIVNYDEYRKLVESYVDNWDIERVACIDGLILQMAINELIEFPSIPIKVTFDEYLEMAKYYSTPKSSLFINGLLDKISADLIQQGKIVKTGRGLITE
jgi:N utilization substance protein B